MTLTNLWARVMVVHRFHFWRVSELLPHVLLRMVRSGCFYPAGNWVIPTQRRATRGHQAHRCACGVRKTQNIDISPNQTVDVGSEQEAERKNFEEKESSMAKRIRHIAQRRTESIAAGVSLTPNPACGRPLYNDVFADLKLFSSLSDLFFPDCHRSFRLP